MGEMAENVSTGNVSTVTSGREWDAALAPGSDIDSWMEPTINSAQLALLVTKGLILFVIILLTIVGNLLVLLAVCLESCLRSATNCFLVNLALADLLLGLSVLPFSATLELLRKRWFFGEIFCSVWAATDVLCCTASILSLCVISVDRYIGVSRPLTYSSIVTEKRAIVVCVFVWGLAFAISVGPLLGWKDPPQTDPYTCGVTKQTGYVIFSVCFSFYIPTFIILFVYQRIYKAAVRQTKFLETGIKTIKPSGSSHDAEELTLRVHAGGGASLTTTGYSSGGRSMSTAGNNGALDSKGSGGLHSALQGRIIKFKRQKKAAKTLGIVVGVFIICWFPFFFLLPLSTLCEWCYVPPLLFDICFWTGYCNSCLNPIIYACSSREFKRAFRNLLRCGNPGRSSAKKPKNCGGGSLRKEHRDQNHRASDVTILEKYDCTCKTSGAKQTRAIIDETKSKKTLAPF